MYSPKISQDLVPELYCISRDLKQPMTKTVNEILRNYVSIYKEHEGLSPLAARSILEIALENGDDDSHD